MGFDARQNVLICIFGNKTKHGGKPCPRRPGSETRVIRSADM